MIVRVYDGDTVTGMIELVSSQFFSIPIRLIGIDCPELKPSKQAVHREKEIEKAKEARDFLAGIILGKVVDLTIHQVDKYGRFLSTITFNKIDISQLMLENKFAKPYDGKKKQPFFWEEEKET